MVGGISNILLNPAALSDTVGASPAYRAESIDLRARYVRNGPRRKFTIAVFAEYICVHIVDIDATIHAEKMSETSAVENGSRSDHAPPVVSGAFKRHMSQNIHGIAHDDYHPGAFLADYVIDNIADYR
jgi:hypothetical protein